MGFNQTDGRLVRLKDFGLDYLFADEDQKRNGVVDTDYTGSLPHLCNLWKESYRWSLRSFVMPSWPRGLLRLLCLSLSTIVTVVVVGSPASAFERLFNSTSKVSFGSLTVSSMIRIVTLFEVSPGAKTSVPEAAT